MLKRKVMSSLLEWKKTDAGRTAILIDGARRIGKSYIAEAFAKAEYRSYCIIDFNRNLEKVKDLFELYLDDLDTFYFLLQERLNVVLHRGESLVIFDEVQLYPKARAAIKYLVADGRYHYLETGSLISIKNNVKSIVIPSEERHLKMHPMDFEEFLWAIGDETSMPLIRKHFLERKPLGRISHEMIMTLFKQYMVVGGMPQAVLAFSETKNLDLVEKIKSEILAIYRDDIRKYSGRLVNRIALFYDDIPHILQRHDIKVRPSTIEPGARMRSWEDVFIWLMESMIVNVAFNTCEPNIGLSANADRSSIKCYMADTGLLISHTFNENASLARQLQRRILDSGIVINEGWLMENIVAQMLTANGHKLYFFTKVNRESRTECMEIDFLLAKSRLGKSNNIMPVEVKSGPNTRHASLDKFRTKYARFIGESYLLHVKDLVVEDGLTRLPVYMACCL